MKNNIRLAVQGKIPHAQRAMASLFERLPLPIAPPPFKYDPVVKDTATNEFDGQDGDPSAMRLVQSSTAGSLLYEEAQGSTEEVAIRFADAQEEYPGIECKDPREFDKAASAKLCIPELLITSPSSLYPGLFGGPGRAAIAKKKKAKK